MTRSIEASDSIRLPDYLGHPAFRVRPSRPVGSPPTGETDEQLSVPEYNGDSASVWAEPSEVEGD